MTHKERIQSALQFKQPDRIPVDFGGTAVTGMHVSCIAALRDHFGLEKRPVKANEPYQMLGIIEEDLIEALGIDTIGVVPENTMFGFPNKNWKEWKTNWGQVVLVSEEFRITEEPNGDILIYPKGDLNAPPSGRMPKTGFFFDTIVRQQPFSESELDPEDNCEEFEPISDHDLAYFKREVETAAQSGRSVIATFGGTAFGDIALIPAPFLKHPKGIRDIQEWYMSTVMRQDYIHQVFEKQARIAVQNLENIFKEIGNAIDVIFICGTDFGTQNSSFCSTDTYDVLYAPYYKKVNDWIHTNTTWKTFKHSCGAVESFIPHFIASGFDILNPVQCSAAGMEPKQLKQKYGQEIIFWGGGVDTQKTLPFGTPEDVRRQVSERCEIFGPSGGFVFNTIHNIQARTPVENIVAMFEALKEF